MAELRIGRGRHQVLAARPDQRGHDWRSRDRLAPVGAPRRRPRRPRPHRLGGGAEHPADGRRTALHQHRPRHGGGARRDDGRAALVRRAAGPRRRALPARAPDARRRLLGGPGERRGARAGRGGGVSRGRRCPHGRAVPRFRGGRRGGPAQGLLPRRRHVPLGIPADRRQRRRRHRLVDHGRRQSDAARPQAGAAGRRARLRRPGPAISSGPSGPSRRTGSSATRPG